MRGRGQGTRAPSARGVAESFAGWLGSLAWPIALSACLAPVAAAIADHAVDASERARPVQTLDEERISASALPTTAAAATQHVTVLRRAELDAMRVQCLSEIPFDPEGVYPMIDNPSQVNYPAELRAALISAEFAEIYQALLSALSATFNGNPGNIKTAIGTMYSLALIAEQLMQTPSGLQPGMNAGPQFVVPVP